MRLNIFLLTLSEFRLRHVSVMVSDILCVGSCIDDGLKLNPQGECRCLDNEQAYGRLVSLNQDFSCRAVAHADDVDALLKVCPRCSVYIVNLEHFFSILFNRFNICC